MDSADFASTRVYPGIVLAALTVAVAAAIASMVAPALGLVLGGAGVWLSVLSRRALHESNDLSGWGVSTAAAIVSSVTVALGVIFFVSPWALSWLFLITG